MHYFYNYPARCCLDLPSFRTGNEKIKLWGGALSLSEQVVVTMGC